MYGINNECVYMCLCLYRANVVVVVIFAVTSLFNMYGWMDG